MKKMMNRFLSLMAAMILVFLLAVPAFADQQTIHVIDGAKLLTPEQAVALEKKAAELSERYQIGVYIATFDDFTAWGATNIERFTEDLYDQWELGYGSGSNRDAVMLCLSMYDRDYDIFAHGDFGNAAFTDYGKEQLAYSFLDEFRANDWNGGFSDFLDFSETMLEMAKNGEPLDVPQPEPRNRFSLANLLVRLGILPSLFAGAKVTGEKAKMKSVKKASTANAYIAENGVHIAYRNDRYIRSTVMRQHIEHNNNRSGGGGGGTTISSHGSSHHSGKF